MNSTGGTLDQAYFDRLYARDPDPWGFTTSQYEKDKYGETLSVLRRERYTRGLEVGCSIGELTLRLARRCESLEALDIADAALAQARIRNAEHAHVRFSKAVFPNEVPEGSFDLILLSEFLYFLSDDDLARSAELVCRRTEPGADILMVHWLGETPDFPSTGDSASERFIAAASPTLSIVRQMRRELYRIDLLERVR